jgi:chromosome segregation ATPase
MSSLIKQLEDSKDETRDLQKQLTAALSKIASLNEDLRREEGAALKATAELTVIRVDLDKVKDEKAALAKAVDALEDDVIGKEVQIEKLQQVVETQLDMVEDLEEKLEETELELFKVEDELKALERVGTLDLSMHADRFARRDSIQKDMAARKGTVKNKTKESRDVLSQSMHQTSTPTPNMRKRAVSGSADLEERESKVVEKERLLEEEKERWTEKIRSLESEIAVLSSKGKEEVVKSLRQSIDELTREKEVLLQEIAEAKDAKTEAMARLGNLENECHDLRLKLDLANDVGSASEEIRKMQQQIADKDNTINSLEEKLKNINGSNVDDDDSGKDLLIRELQNQLVAAKKTAEELNSGDYLNKLKLEIKSLRHAYNELKKRMKKEETDTHTKLKKKDDTIQFLQKEMLAIKRELERREKREKNVGSDFFVAEGDLMKHVEDLEDEIDHWKAINADLENELDLLKSEASEWKKSNKNKDDADSDGDSSVGSNQSELSHHSIASITSNDLFFISDSNSMRGHRSVTSANESSAHNQRSLRSFSSLWSKMSRAEPTPQPNPAIPYGAGSLDIDD